jgi:hypothetical protein
MSTGVAAVRHLQATNAPLLATVPATRIMAGVLPQGVALPAIGITQVSATRRQAVALSSGATRLVTARVQVTIMASTYPALRALATLVHAALPATRGTVGTAKVDGLVHAGDGPDFLTEEGIHQTSLDFIVRTHE